MLIKPIPRPLAKRFIGKHHYSGGCGNAAMSWGLYHNPTGRLIGAISFQTPIGENVRKSIFELRSSDYDSGSIPSWNQCGCGHIVEEHGYREHVTELHRLAIVDDAPQNTATWFISRALKRLKEHKPKYWAVVSFADSTEGHDGTVYQAANADYYGMTGTRTIYRDENGRLRHARQNSERITIEEAQQRGWTPESRDAKHRYIFWLPDRYREVESVPSASKDQLRQMATIELQEYPGDGDE